MSLWPIGGFVSSDDISPNTLCFLKEAYSPSRVSCHSEDALASESVSGSGATLVANTLRMVVAARCNLGGFDEGATYLFSGSGFRRILGPE